jgi:hypothetical protein
MLRIQAAAQRRSIEEWVGGINASIGQSSL